MRNASQNVINYRRRIKRALVIAFGGKCAMCGGIFDDKAYDFHHIIPEEKSFGIAANSTTRSKNDIAEEAKKCVMLCAVCHRLVDDNPLSKYMVSNFDEELFFAVIKKLAEERPIKKPSKADKARAHSRKPERNVLKDNIRNNPMTEVGRMYDVTDNAIRKWCISYNLPHKKSEINLISDEDWTLI